MPKKQNKYLAELKEKQLLFNLKITDLTMIENPFVFYENLQVDDQGYLLFERSEEEEILRRREQANKPKPLTMTRRPVPLARQWSDLARYWR